MAEQELSPIEKYWSNYDNYGGYMLPHFTVDQMKIVEDYPVDDNDVFLSSYPKSGTTWMQQIVLLIHNGVDIEDARKETFEDRFPYIEYYYPGAEKVAQMPPPRLIKTHLPYDLLPKKTREGKGKVICIARNPKDTMTSYFFFIQMIRDLSYEGSLEDLVEAFLTDKIGCGPWWKFQLSYWHRRNDPNVFFVTYEQMQQDTSGWIRKVAEFLGTQLTDKQIETIVHHSSFGSMSKNPAANYAHWDKKGFANEGKSKFMRKGKVGDWKNHISEVQSKRIDDYMAKHCTPEGLSFIYE